MIASRIFGVALAAAILALSGLATAAAAQGTVAELGTTGGRLFDRSYHSTMVDDLPTAPIETPGPPPRRGVHAGGTDVNRLGNAPPREGLSVPPFIAPMGPNWPAPPQARANGFAYGGPDTKPGMNRAPVMPGRLITTRATREPGK